MIQNSCDACHHYSSSYFFDKEEGKWLCGKCYVAPPLMDTCRLFEFGHENLEDPKGSTAHVRDIKARRLDTKTKQMYYETKPKTYFLPR